MPDLQSDTDKLIRARQRSRAIVMGLILGALVILVFAITIVKIKAGMPH
ncbi:hypothetical protein [Sphingomonas sp. So64.6b]|nr:hypothetical protein [Sphingomonas sp. So64.6b]